MRRSGPTRDERDLFDELIRIAGETPFRPPAEEARIRELLALAHRHALAGAVRLGNERVETQQQPHAADILNHRMSALELQKLFLKILSRISAMLNNIFSFHIFHNFKSRRRDHRCSAECGCMRAGGKGRHDVLFCQHGADGQAVGQGLGQGHDIRRDAVMLVGEELSGPADAGLDLV